MLSASAKPDVCIVKLSPNEHISDNYEPVVKIDARKLDKLNIPTQAQLLLSELQSYYIVPAHIHHKHTIPTSILSIDTAKTTSQVDTKRWYLTTIKAMDAWKLATGNGIVVAVLDTGIDYNDSVFTNKLWVNPLEDLNGNGIFDFGDINGIDDDGNGYIDDVIGYDFINKAVIIQGDTRTPDPDPYDEHRHGTQVASVVLSVAPNTKIMALRTHDVSGNSECKDIANAIVYAVLNGANVINLSSGEYDDSPLLHTAIKFAFAMNCVVVASAGNEGKTTPHFPSDYPEVISVGGCDQQQRRIFNYGDRLTITAPGANIYVATLNNEWTYNNGTSFSAPIVSAVVAMLLEKDVTLTPTDIKGIIQNTATQVANGWTPEYGAGIVNAYAALQNIAKTKIEIATPFHNSIINLSHTDTITITGSTATPLIDTWLVRISANGKTWDTISAPSSMVVIDGHLCNLATALFDKQLKDKIETYTISLTLNLKNGNTFEDRIHIGLCTDSTLLKITDFEIYQPYYYDNRIPLFNIKTNIPTIATIYYKDKNSADTNYHAVISNEYITDNHSLAVENIPIDTDIEGYVEAYVPTTELVARQPFEFRRRSDHFDSYTFTKKPYSFASSYLYKSTFGDNEILASPFSIDDVGKLYIYKLDDTAIVAVDSSQSNGYAQGIGDSNGDGILEIMTGYYGNSALYQPQAAGESQFSNQIFSTSNYDAMYCEGLFDFDGDGKDEILFCDNWNSFYIYSYVADKYQLLLQANINDLMYGIDTGKYALRNGVAVGNFYSDGKNYLALTTAQNNYLLIVDVSGFQAVVKDYYKLDYPYYRETFTQIPITAGDIDNDGRDEIIYLSYGKINDVSGILGKTELWTYQVFSANNNGITKLFEDDIWGVRNYSPMRNAVHTGNIDGIAGDEVVIATFPNLYVLKWDADTKQLSPMWSYPANNTNAVVIADFDKNGDNEICFTTFGETEFYEFVPDYKIGSEVAYFKGYAISSTAAHFEWRQVENSEYELWIIETSELSNPSSVFTIYKTANNTADINDLQPNTNYTSYVKLQTTNYFSEIVTITTKPITKPLIATMLNTNLLKVKYSERLQMNIEAGSFLLKKLERNISPISCLSLITDSSVALVFAEDLEDGTYYLLASSITDYYGNPTISDTLQVIVSNVHSDELYLTSLIYAPPATLYITFSEAVDTYTATHIANYKLAPYGEIADISILATDKLRIDLSGNLKLEARGKDYLITANIDIMALSGRKMTAGAGNTLGFTLATNSLSKIYVYPSPIRLSTHSTAYIGHLTHNAKIEIQSIAGKLLRTLDEYDGNGGTEWDLRDNNGNICGIGIYIIRATNNTNGGGDVTYCKFVIVE